MIALRNSPNILKPATTLKYKNFVIQRLNASHVNDVIKLLATQFAEQQPLSNAFYRSFPLEKHRKVQKWAQFWQFFSTDFTTNQVSIVCFDMENRGELIAAIVAKDLNYAPQGFEDKYMRDINFMSNIIRVEQKLLGLVHEQYQPLLKTTGVVMDMWGGALKKGYMGKQLLHKIIQANEYFGTLKGYQYSFTYTSNYKSEIAINKLKYQKIATCDITDFEVDGVKVLEKVEEIHKSPSLFLKKLSIFQNNGAIE